GDEAGPDRSGGQAAWHNPGPCVTGSGRPRAAAGSDRARPPPAEPSTTCPATPRSGSSGIHGPSNTWGISAEQGALTCANTDTPHSPREPAASVCAGQTAPT